jgi:hypothetical protein
MAVDAHAFHALLKQKRCKCTITGLTVEWWHGVLGTLLSSTVVGVPIWHDCALLLSMNFMSKRCQLQGLALWKSLRRWDHSGYHWSLISTFSERE